MRHPAGPPLPTLHRRAVAAAALTLVAATALFWATRGAPGRPRAGVAAATLAAELDGAPVETLVDRAAELSVAAQGNPDCEALAPLVLRLARHVATLPAPEARRLVPLVLPALDALGMEARVDRLLRRLDTTRPPRPAAGLLEDLAVAGDVPVEPLFAAVERIARTSRARDMTRLVALYRRLSERARPGRLRARIVAATEKLFGLGDPVLRPGTGVARAAYVNRGPLLPVLGRW